MLKCLKVLCSQFSICSIVENVLTCLQTGIGYTETDFYQHIILITLNKTHHVKRIKH